MPKLKDHLIPRLKDVLWESRTVGSHSGPPSKDTRLFSNETQPDWDLIYFKSDRIYLHKLTRFQYTTYNLWRDQDVINPLMLHWDIVMLTTTKDDQDHPFLYACVLGIYHTNIVYTGDNSKNYKARQFEFLWVRWYQYQGPNVWWSDSKLDLVSFPPITSEGAFGFVDPDNVLHACHMIPVFPGGKKHLDGIGLSHCACDGLDWSQYYVNWWVKGSSNYCLVPLMLLPKQIHQPRHDNKILLGSSHWPHICSYATIILSQYFVCTRP